MTGCKPAANDKSMGVKSEDNGKGSVFPTFQ
jgi:hypothetical protein